MTPILATLALVAFLRMLFCLLRSEPEPFDARTMSAAWTVQHAIDAGEMDAIQDYLDRDEALARAQQAGLNIPGLRAVATQSVAAGRFPDVACAGRKRST